MYIYCAAVFLRLNGIGFQLLFVDEIEEGNDISRRRPRLFKDDNTYNAYLLQRLQLIQWLLSRVVSIFFLPPERGSSYNCLRFPSHSCQIIMRARCRLFFYVPYCLWQMSRRLCGDDAIHTIQLGELPEIECR